MRSPRSHSGMTLIEILVVMALMTTLVSILVVAAFSAQKRGQVAGTKGLLETLAQGLETYKTVHRMYPPCDPNNPRDYASDLYDANNPYRLWAALELSGDIKPIEARYKKEGVTTRTDPKTGAQVKQYWYVDAWNQRITYECLLGAKFQLYKLTSYGPDLVQGTGDDILKEP